MSEFTGLAAVVTGGGSGIGAAIVTRLLDGGAKVAALDLRPEGASDGALRVTADVSDDASVSSAIAQVVAEFRQLDIVVNNAGVGAQGTIETGELDEWRRVYEINVLGMVRMSRAALPHLRRSQHASIVNTCSVVATAGFPERALYSASKGAVLSLTRAMAADHLSEGIRVNCVNPGTADTPWIQRLLASAADPSAELTALEARQPHGRLVAASEVADAVAYLASPRSGSTTGTSLAVDGGVQGLRLRPRES